MTAAPRPTCRHCNSRPVNRHRGLCHICYADLAVRNLYPRQLNHWPQRPPVYCRTCGRRRWSTSGDGPDCSTCSWEEPERSRRHARIDAHQRRVQAVLAGREDAA